MGSKRDELLKKYASNSNPAVKTNANGNKESGTTQNTSGKSSSVREKMLAKYSPGQDSSAIDDDYISKFLSDVNDYFGRARSDYNGISYSTANSAYDSHNKEISDLFGRSRAIRSYLRDNRGSYSKEDYDQFNTQLYKINTALSEYSDAFFNVKKQMSKFGSEEEYNTARKNYEWQQKYKDSSIEDLRKLTLDDEEEQKWVKSYIQYLDDEEKGNYDLVAGQKEIDDLEAERQKILDEKKSRNAGTNGRPYAGGQQDAPDFDSYTTGYGITNNRPYAAGLQVQKQETPEDTRLREIDQLISKKKQYLNQAKHIQEINAYDDTVNNADFDQYDDYAESDDTLYNWINDSRFRERYEASYQSIPNPNARRSKFARKGYDRMSASEIAIFNYYYAKSGKEAAQKYLDTIQERLNERTAEEMYSTVQDDVAAELVFGVSAGLNQFGSNVANNFKFKDDYIAKSAYQIASGMVREDLADNGPKLPKILGGASLGQIAYDVVTTGANMAPSILVGMATGVPVLGSAAMGLSAAGGAYQQALNEGYDKNQARGYSMLVGASEMAMEKLLGGISAVGGNALGRNAVKNIANADTALKAIGLRIGGSALSEFGEEYLQEVLDPVFSNIMLKTDKEVKPISAEALYSGILGMLTGAIMEAPSAIYGEAQTASTGRKLKEAGGVDSLAKIGNTFAADTVAYKLAGKVNENTGAYTIGQLLKEVDATLTEQNVSEIAEALMKENIGEIAAKKYAKAFAYVVEGGAMPDSMVNAIEADTVLAKAAREVLIDSNTTWNQRTQGYNEALRKLAMDKVTGKKSGKVTPANDQQMTGKSTSEESTVVENADESRAETVAAPKVSKIQTIEKGKTTVKLDDGTEVDLKDAALDPEDSVRIETIANVDGMSAEDASTIYSILKTAGGKSAQMDALGAKEAYQYGYYGLPESQLTEHAAFANSLTETQRKAVYEIGQKARQKKVENTTFKKSGAPKVAGKVHFDGDRSALNERQQVSLKTMDRIAEVLGVQIYVFESKVGRNGKRIGENGWYDPKDGSIHIDLYAGATGEATMLFTLAHELTHYIRQWSPQKFKVLADFLMEEYGKKGVRIESLIREQQNKAKRNGRTISYDTAYEEVVADSMEMMLSDGNVMKRLEKLKTKDKDLWSQFKRFVDNMAAKIREVYKGLKPDSKEAELVKEMGDTIYRLQELFAEGLVEASENFQTAEKNTTEDGGVKMMVRENVVDANGKKYDKVIKPGLTVYESVKHKKRDYISHLRKKIFKRTFTVDDIDGEQIPIEFAKDGETVQKDGANNPHPVLGELEAVTDRLKMIAIINIKDLIKNSKPLTPSSENSHQWLDEGGWRDRVSYMTDFDVIYPVILHIPKTRDGRYLLYDISVLKKEGTSIDMDATALAAQSARAPETTENGSQSAVEVLEPSGERVTQPEAKVNNKSTKAMDLEADEFVSEYKDSHKGVKYSTRESDADYMDAVKRGDMETAQPKDGLKKSNRDTDGTKFSMRESVEETKDLLAYHNITAKLLLDVLERNGLLMPSLAITNKGMTDFGEISLLFDKSTIDPSSSEQNKLYGADAWTPTQTQLKKNAKFDTNKTVNAVNTLKNSIGTKYVSDLFNITAKQFRDTIIKADGSIYDAYAHDIGMQTAYAMEKGIISKIPTTKSGTVDKVALQAQLNSEMDTDNGWRQYKRWLNNISDTIITSYDKASNADILRNMKAQPASAKTFKLSENGELVVPAVEYASIDEARRNRNRLSENAAEETKAVADEFIALAKSIGDTKSVVNAINRAFANRYSVADIVKTFNRSGINMSTETARQLQALYKRAVELPTQYFEAKPHREIGLDEIKAVVMPDSADMAEVKAKLEEIGVFVVEYKAGSKEARVEALNSMENLKFSDRDTESVSNRSLLANAMESLAKTDLEKKKLTEYKAKIDQINAEEQKLSEVRAQIKELSFAKGPRDKEKLRALRDEAIKLSHHIGIYDKQLLRLEASKPLQNVLDREKEKAYQRGKEKGEAALKEYKQKAMTEQEQMKKRYEESRKRSVENRNKTAMRHKIQNVVKELNSLLLTNDKKRHVPDNLKKPVKEALELLNMDTVDAENRAAKYADLIAKEQAKANPDQDKIDSYTMTMENILRQGEKMGQRVKELHAAYEEIRNSDDPDIANAYDPVISGAIQELAGTIKNTSIKNMTMDQLSDVYDVYRAVLTRVRDANKAMAENIRASIEELAKSTIREVQTVGGSKKYRVSNLDAVRKFDWNNMKPVYAMERIGSSTLTEVFNNVRAGEDTWAKDISEAREYYLEKSKKYGYDKWDFDKKYRFESNSGIPFEVTLEQILSLYAYSKREQAADHLRIGGFVFDSNIETYKEKDGKKSILKYKVNTADAHQITPEIMADIIGKLSKEQAGFVDEMQDYLSTVMGAKGNEVTSKMYGVKLFKEKFYFPLKSAKQFMFEQNEVSGEVRIKNSGFTNKVVAKANNPVILSNFMDVWSGHVNDMSMYHAFTLPLEDFNRVFHYAPPKRDGVEPVSVESTIQNAYGPAAVSYVEQLITDLNGGARTDPRTGFINKTTALHKKGAVLASLSVVIQQPSAIARATALIDLKYFDGYSAGTLPKVALDFAKQSLHDVFNLKKETNHDKEWAELKKYAPVAIIKEMGYFDANMGKSTQDYITGKEYSGFKEKVKATVTDSAYRDELLSKAPSLADEVAWCAIWRAVKRETFHRHNNLRPSSDALLKLAGERFTEVITKTQVYDSVLARSANMRSKDTGMNMATAFMAEPTTAINMLLDAHWKGKRGNKIYRVRTNAAVLSSIILNSILVSIVYAGRDDDEDETYAEKYLGALTRALIDGINPAMYFPFIKDIWSIIQGYDVERSDMALANDLLKAWKKLSREDVSPYQKAQDFAGTAAMFLGFPLKNIMRDFKWIWQMLVDPILGNDSKTEKTTLAGIKYAQHHGRTGKDIPDKEQLYKARLAGDEKHAERVAARYDDEDSADAAVRAAIKDSFMADEIDEATAVKHMVLYAGMDGSEAHWTMDAWKYRKKVGSDEGYGKYGKFHDAVRSGKNLESVIKEYTDNGVKTSTLTGEITEEFKTVYLEASSSERAAMKTKLISAYVACDMEREDAEKKLESWDFEAEYGFAYSDRKEAYLSEEVSKATLVDILIDRGYDEEDAEAQVEAYEWEAAGFEDVTTSAIRNYNEWCEPVGIPKSVYLEFWRFDNSTENDVDKTTGKKIAYSAVKKIMAYIDSLNLTDAQKDALAKSAGWSEKTIQKYKLW